MSAGEPAGDAVWAGAELPGSPADCFETVLDELRTALGRRGLRFAPGPGGGVYADDAEVASVVEWSPPARVVLAWRPADWLPEASTEVEVRLEAAGAGTRVTVVERGLAQVVGERGGGELAGWFAQAVAAPLLAASAPGGLGEWLTDRVARRPSGAQARDVYRDPLFHRPNFRALLAALALRPEDRLVEVGCGGGALLAEALQSGCSAAAIDHSAEMVRLARETNRDAVAEGRLEVVEGSAERLPFPDAGFTCAVCTGVFGFLPEPLAALRELRRVLADGGRLAMFLGSKELRGTPAAPEPVASRLRFYEDDELDRLLREAGFREVRVEHPDLARYARKVGVPEEALPLMGGRAGQLVLARR